MRTSVSIIFKAIQLPKSNQLTHTVYTARLSALFETRSPGRWIDGCLLTAYSVFNVFWIGGGGHGDREISRVKKMKGKKKKDAVVRESQRNEKGRCGK